MILSPFGKSDFSMKQHRVCTFKLALSTVAIFDLFLIFSCTVTYVSCYECKAVLGVKMPSGLCKVYYSRITKARCSLVPDFPLDQNIRQHKKQCMQYCSTPLLQRQWTWLNYTLCKVVYSCFPSAWMKGKRKRARKRGKKSAFMRSVWKWAQMMIMTNILCASFGNAP